MKTILFDAEVLASKFLNSAKRSGIFFVAYNIFLLLKKRRGFKVVLFFTDEKAFADNYEKFKADPDFRDVPIFPSYDTSDMPRLRRHAKLAWQMERRQARLAKRRGLFRFILKAKMSIACLRMKAIGDFPRNADYSGIDIYFSPMYAIPEEMKRRKRIRKFIFLHDAIPALFPEWYRGREVSIRWFFRMVESLGCDIHAFCYSRSTRDDFLKVYGDRLDAKKMFLTSIGTGQPFVPERSPDALSRTLEKYGAGPVKKYIFSLCTLEPRKNLIFTIKCFVEFIRRNKIDDLYFLLGGGHFDHFIKAVDKEIAGLGPYRDRIVKLGYIDDSDLASLYSNSLFFAYLSLYEGFGIPILEAMSSGVPVVASSAASMPEVGGQAALLVPPTDMEACVEAFERLYFDGGLRAKLSKAGLERASEFGWDRTIDDMCAAFSGSSANERI